MTIHLNRIVAMVAIERNSSKFCIEQGKFCRHSIATEKNLTQFQYKICPLQPISNRGNNANITFF